MEYIVVPFARRTGPNVSSQESSGGREGGREGGRDRGGR